jgi:hypothetical protein
MCDYFQIMLDIHIETERISLKERDICEMSGSHGGMKMTVFRVVASCSFV